MRQSLNNILSVLYIYYILYILYIIHTGVSVVGYASVRHQHSIYTILYIIYIIYILYICWNFGGLLCVSHPITYYLYYLCVHIYIYIYTGARWSVMHQSIIINIIYIIYWSLVVSYTSVTQQHIICTISTSVTQQHNIYIMYIYILTLQWPAIHLSVNNIYVLYLHIYISVDLVI